VALSQRHRSEIYNVWAPQLGEEVAEALISHFPSRDLDEPVTKEFVQIQVAELRGEVHDGDASLRSEIAELRGEMHQGFAGLRAEIAGVRTEVSDLRGEFRAELQSELRKFALFVAGMQVTTIAAVVSIMSALG